MRSQLIHLITVILILVTINTAIATNQFTCNYPCHDGVKTCLSSGSRVIDGFEVTKDCWEYSYDKTCDYPSKDNCRDYKHCYAVALRECLLEDSMGNCVNQVQELSCKRWEPSVIEQPEADVRYRQELGLSRIVCRGVPCIDGNCFDQSYVINDEMMDSVSKLSSIAAAKGAGNLQFKLFEGAEQHCSKKATSYTNCCSTSFKGWGKALGAGCSDSEKDLIEKRKRNLCVYVGKTKNETLGVTTVVKHRYCCFGSMLHKVIQVEGRKQLGLSFGSAENPDCRGLTLEEMMRLDFEKMDFSEFYAEIIQRMKLPNLNDINARIKGGLPSMKPYNENASAPEKQRSGINQEYGPIGDTEEYGN